MMRTCIGITTVYNMECASIYIYIHTQVYQEHYQQTKKTIEKDFIETEALLEALDISDSSLKKVGRWCEQEV